MVIWQTLKDELWGKNVIEGNKVIFPGTQQTGICKLFDYGIGITGLSESKAKEENINFVKVVNASPDKPGFMDGKLLITKLLADSKKWNNSGSTMYWPWRC